MVPNAHCGDFRTVRGDLEWMARGTASIFGHLQNLDRSRAPGNLSLDIAAQTRYPQARDLHGDHDVAQDRPDPNETQPSGQILTFQLRRRVGMPVPRHAPLAPHGDGTEAVDDLAAFEEEDRNIDYRHRMLMNVIAVVIVTLLVTAGVWIADTIAAMQKAQDCALQGRQNCAPIEVPVIKR
jgi:hypothetical protein